MERRLCSFAVFLVSHTRPVVYSAVHTDARPGNPEQKAADTVDHLPVLPEPRVTVTVNIIGNGVEYRYLERSVHQARQQEAEEGERTVVDKPLVHCCHGNTRTCPLVGYVCKCFLRSASLSFCLRRRIDCGQTSRYSSSCMISRPNSIERGR